MFVKKIKNLFYRTCLYRFITMILILKNFIVYREKTIVNKNRNNTNNETFYVIRRYAPKVGLFSHFITNLGSLEYALDNGYIPVVDMKNYKNSIQEKDDLHKINIWDLFFEQPLGYSLEEALHGKRIVLGRGCELMHHPTETMSFFNNINGQRDYWKNLCRKYIKLNQKTEQHIDQVYSKLINKNDRVLGVLCRGTDYIALQPKGHPKQPQISDIINRVNEFTISYRCNKIFLATEDEKIVNVFKKKYGDKLIMAQQTFVEYTSGYLASKNIPNKQERALDYLTNIVILSRCTGVIAGRTSGAVGMALLADSFEFEYYWDLGIY